jgi:site-specific recombinase XerD
MYGTGIRFTGVFTIVVKDIDFGSGQIIIREGKGDKDRHTVLPQKNQDGIGASPGASEGNS